MLVARSCARLRASAADDIDLATPRVRPTVPARVAAAGANHPPATPRALDCVFPRVEERRLARRRRLGRNRRRRRLDRRPAVRVALRELRAALRGEDPDLPLLLDG